MFPSHILPDIDKSSHTSLICDLENEGHALINVSDSQNSFLYLKAIKQIGIMFLSNTLPELGDLDEG